MAPSKGNHMTTSAAGRRVEVNGASLYVEEHGQGVPVVLIHGATTSHSMWDAVVPLLAPHVRVITFDFRGHGDSTHPSGALSLRVIADDVAALIEALELEHPFVGGWSAGGAVTVDVGMRHPSIARGLLAGGARVRSQTEDLREQTRAVFHARENGQVDFETFLEAAPEFVAFLRSVHPHGEAQWQWVAQHTLMMIIESPDLTEEQVQQISVPTLIIHADHDQLIPMDDALTLFRWLPNAELAVLPGCDHQRPFTEPATFAAAVLDFIARHARDEFVLKRHER
jgi:pimeloyl-ACP methyl ester carboxylesterase